MTRQRAPWRRTTASVTALAFALAAPLSARIQAKAEPQAPIRILHEELDCVNTEIAPKVDAAVAPGQEYEKGYVYFKAAGTEDYYYVLLQGPADRLETLLPRPLPETQTIDYHVKAQDRQDLTTRTRDPKTKTGDFDPPVLQGNACRRKGAAAVKNGAGLTVGLTKEKQSPIPPGFNKRDIAKVILVSGAVVTVAAALKLMAGTSAAAAGSTGAGTGTAAGSGAAAGGGVSTGLIVAGGAVVVAGVAVAASSSGDSNPAPTPTPTPVPNRFVQAEVSWSGVGDVDLQVLNSAGSAVGQTIAAGCDASGANRTERVLLQGASLTNGTYQVRLTGRSCGPSTPGIISTIVTVLADTGPKCSAGFVGVPVGQTVSGCSFTVP